MEMEYNIAKEWIEKRVHTSVKRGSEDFDIMENILKNHPNYKDWKNSEIEYFRITRAPKKKSLQVYMKMQGISNPRIVSWVACVKGKKRKIDNLSAAMRNTVHNQINNYTITHPIRKCLICESYSKIEVDHYPIKFRDLKKNFLEERKERKEEDDIPSIYFYKNRYIFSRNNDFVSNWYNYHLKHAKYRYLCENCNQKAH